MKTKRLPPMQCAVCRQPVVLTLAGRYVHADDRTKDYGPHGHRVVGVRLPG